MVTCHGAGRGDRIALACNCLLVEYVGSSRLIVVEVGHGPKYAPKEQKIFAIDPEHWLLPGLAALGVDASDVSDVVLTHLHFDHAGGLTQFAGEESASAPVFPAARVHVQEQELRDARDGFGIMTATYRRENLRPAG